MLSFIQFTILISRDDQERGWLISKILHCYYAIPTHVIIEYKTIITFFFS